MPPSDGWFAAVPDPRARDVSDDDIRGYVVLGADELAGFPLWDDEGHLGDDFDYLHDKLGLDRELYEDLDTWNQAFACGTATEQHDAQGRELWERLASRLPPGVLLRPRAS